MHIENAPEFSTVEEHIAELYRRMDVLHDRIESMDLAFYPLCLVLTAQHPSVMSEIRQSLTETLHRLQNQADFNRNRVYALEQFLKTTQDVEQSWTKREKTVSDATGSSV